MSTDDHLERYAEGEGLISSVKHKYFTDPQTEIWPLAEGHPLSPRRREEGVCW